MLERLWNPNCSVAGADSVIVPVKFSVGDDGRVIGRVAEGGRDSSPDPVVFAAARRAIDAVHQAAPYAEAYRGKSFTVNFDAGKACAGVRGQTFLFPLWGSTRRPNTRRGPFVGFADTSPKGGRERE